MFKTFIDFSSAAIDYFVGDVYKTDTDMRYKARLLVGCTLSFIIGVLAFGLFYIAIEALTTEAVFYYYALSAPMVFFWCWMLNVTKKGRHYELCSHSIIASAAIVLFGGILITGGPAKTEVMPLIIIPVVLAFIMLGQRPGLMWAAIVGGINYFLVMLDFFDVQFMNVAPTEAVKQLRIFNWSYSFITVVSLVMIYESMNRRLTIERNIERERFRHMAMHDVLTGLPNRKYFDEGITSTLALADRSKSSVAIGLLDLNGFKPINDEIGHEAGDIVLQVVSERMQDVLRKSDQIARLGGDEFAFILNNVKSVEDVANVAEKILAAIAKPIQVNSDGSRQAIVTGSLGLAVFPEDSRDENELRVFSDKAMFSAKRAKVGWRMYSEMPETIAAKSKNSEQNDAADFSGNTIKV